MTERTSWLSQMFAAVAFAEEGEFDTARALLGEVRLDGTEALEVSAVEGAPQPG
ncbi:MAG: hypothetical protein ABT940_11275 [Alphaproteobacteria bacterium]